MDNVKIVMAMKGTSTCPHLHEIQRSISSDRRVLVFYEYNLHDPEHPALASKIRSSWASRDDLECHVVDGKIFVNTSVFCNARVVTYSGSGWQCRLKHILLRHQIREYRTVCHLPPMHFFPYCVNDRQGDCFPDQKGLRGWPRACVDSRSN